MRRWYFLLVLLLFGVLPASAQDTFLTVLDVLGASYRLPLTDCPTQGMTYTRATNSFGCASGSTYPAPGSTTQVLFNDAGLIGADAGFTYVKGTDTATLGALVLNTATGNILVANTTTLVVDATNHLVGIGTATPSGKLFVLDTSSDPAGTVSTSSSSLTTTITGTNATVSRAYNGAVAINQNGFNFTAAQGARAGDFSASATGATGTVTGAVAVRASVSNTGAGTLTDGWGVLTAVANSGGGTFATWTNYYAPPSTVGSVATYGFRSAIVAAATRWNTYNDGTAQNFFAGSVGIGTGKSVALTVLDVANVSTNAVRGIITGQYSASADGGRLIGRKARGTAAAPTVITTGDALASWVGEGYDGSNFLQMGSIVISSTGTIASTRVPTTMIFQTATDAAPSVLTTALTLNANQSATFAAGITATTVAGTGVFTPISGTAVTAGGALAVTLGSSAPGIYTGSGVPTISAAKGSLYLRSDGTGVADRAYINLNGTTGWTAIATAG